MKIIIQAGGRGSRLEGLTINKPKCLVAIDNFPIIFHLFKKFPNAEFSIIADYKIEVLEKYLKIFASEYNYKIIKATKSGTISGIKEVISNFKQDEQFMIIWCDLILGNDFKIPKKGNWIGISNDFECRWSYINDKFIKQPSKENGVAGLFVFENKKPLKNIIEEGAFVDWLQKQNIVFKRLNLKGTKEIGTLLSYSDNSQNTPRYRVFNKFEFKDDIVIKTPIDEQGKKIAQDEINWYKHVQKLGFNNIPIIYEYQPLKMKRVQGKNIFEYENLNINQKKEIIKNIIDTIKSLHNLEPKKPINIDDCYNIYYKKTFNRLSKVQDIIPFTDKKFININGKNYKNPIFYKDKIEKIIKNNYPENFNLIHGDTTFSNIMFDLFEEKAILIDPRGYFGNTKLYGDCDYDWAKLYYSINGCYDNFNRKKFNLKINPNNIEFLINKNEWTDMEDYFFENLPEINKYKIKLLHGLIWLSLTTYIWEDYDSICGAFYQGIIKLNEII